MLDPRKRDESVPVLGHTGTGSSTGETGQRTTVGLPDRWYAARVGRPPLRLLDQPSDGFASDEVIPWLIERGLARRVDDANEDSGYRLDGWGDAYCMVLGSRNDPWETIA